MINFPPLSWPETQINSMVLVLCFSVKYPITRGMALSGNRDHGDGGTIDRIVPNNKGLKP